MKQLAPVTVGLLRTEFMKRKHTHIRKCAAFGKNGESHSKVGTRLCTDHWIQGLLQYYCQNDYWAMGYF